MKLIAHRGLWNKDIKSNSIEALKKGIESNKYIGIECDVRVTLDGVFIIYHNILYKGELVKNVLYKDIKKDVCLLEDVLKINTDKIVLLEIKDFNLDKKKFLRILNKYKRNIYIMSFDNKIINELSKIDSKHKYGVLNYVLNSDSNYNLDFICLLDIIASNMIVKGFKKNGIEVIIYGTIKPDDDLIYIVDDKMVV